MRTPMRMHAKYKLCGRSPESILPRVSQPATCARGQARMLGMGTSHQGLSNPAKTRVGVPWVGEAVEGEVTPTSKFVHVNLFKFLKEIHLL